MDFSWVGKMHDTRMMEVSWVMRSSQIGCWSLARMLRVKLWSLALVGTGVI